MQQVTEAPTPGRQSWPGVGVGPRVAAVGGPEEVVDVVMGSLHAFVTMPAMYTSPVARSPVIWTLRMKGVRW